MLLALLVQQGKHLQFLKQTRSFTSQKQSKQPGVHTSHGDSSHLKHSLVQRCRDAISTQAWQWTSSKRSSKKVPEVGLHQDYFQMYKSYSHETSKFAISGFKPAFSFPGTTIQPLLTCSELHNYQSKLNVHCCHIQTNRLPACLRIALCTPLFNIHWSCC